LSSVFAKYLIKKAPGKSGAFSFKFFELFRLLVSVEFQRHRLGHLELPQRFEDSHLLPAHLLLASPAPLLAHHLQALPVQLEPLVLVHP